jgi:hypothetical protein
MKKFSILSKIFLLGFFFSFMVYSNVVPGPEYYLINGSGSTINDILIIPYVEDAPELDGEMDSAWIFPPIGMFRYEQFESEDTVPASQDHAAYFKAAYNEDSFYFWAKVLDDIVTGEGSPNSYENDCFEIYFDGDNSDSATYDGYDDVQWRWVYGMTENEAGWCDIGENGSCAWTETDDGYEFELILDAADLADTNIVFEPGNIIGFEVKSSDNDNTGEPAAGTRENIVKWWSLDGTSWLHPVLFGTAALGGDGDLEDEVVGGFVLEMEYGAEIDGEDTDGEWYDVPQVKMTVCENWKMGDDEGFKDFQPYYRAGYNDDGFYFFGFVLDDIATGEGSTNSYENDCFEIYFDGDNSDSATYDGIDDVQWRYVYGYTENEAGWCDLYAGGECAWMEIYGGYQFELFLDAGDLADTNIVLEEGDEIGFEVQCSDNDNTGEPAAGTRDVISKWWNIDGTSWQHPNLFGTVILSRKLTGISEPSIVNINLYVPSILKSNTNISYYIPVKSPVKLNLFNIAGQKVSTLIDEVQNPGTYIKLMDISALANGTYLCKLEACDETIAKKVIIIK